MIKFRKSEGSVSKIKNEERIGKMLFFANSIKR